jgi:hypothetical protein
LIVVTVPAAVVLLEIDGQDRSARIADGLGGIEHRFARLIAQAWANINAPACFIFAVNGELNRASDAVVFAFIVVSLLKVFRAGLHRQWP